MFTKTPRLWRVGVLAVILGLLLGGVMWRAQPTQAQSSEVIFAVDSQTNELWQYINSSWRVIGPPAQQYVAEGATVYRLDSDGKIYKWSGVPNSWIKIDDAGRALYPYGYNLLATDKNTGNIWLYQNSYNHWIEIGPSGTMFTATNDGRVFGLFGGTVRQWNGSPWSWSDIGSSASAIYGGSNLYMQKSGSGELMEYYNGSWRLRSAAAKAFSVSANGTASLARINYDNSVDRHDVSGTGSAVWSKTGASASSVARCNTRLYMIKYGTTELWRHESGTTWTRLDTRTKQIVCH